MLIYHDLPRFTTIYPCFVQARFRVTGFVQPRQAAAQATANQCIRGIGLR